MGKTQQLLSEAHSRIKPGVQEIRHEIDTLVQKRTKHHNSPYHSHVTRMNGIYRNIPKTRNAEEALQHERAGEKVRVGKRYVSDYLNLRVPEHVN